MHIAWFSTMCHVVIVGVLCVYVGRRLRILWGKSQAMQAPPTRKAVIDLPPVPGLPECKYKIICLAQHILILLFTCIYIHVHGVQDLFINVQF